MCYAKPGPRCSSHTRAALKKSQKELKKAQARGDEKAIAIADTAVKDDMYEYCTSPEGLKNLQNRIDAAHERGDQETEESLKSLHDRASADRQARLDAYNRLVQANAENNVEDSLSARFKRLFQKEQPAQNNKEINLNPVQKAPKVINESIPGMVSYNFTGKPASPEKLAEDHRIAAANIAEDALQEVEASAMMDNLVPIVSEQEAKYYYNPELRASRPSLEGWSPRNETHKYAMHQVLTCVLSQRTAAFDNAGISKSAMSKAMDEEYGSGEDSQNFKISVGADEHEDSGPITNFDEGWLYSFHQGVENAKDFDFKDGDEATQKAELRRFALLQRDLWKTKSDTVDNDFNAGGYEAWDTWLQEL